MGNLTAKTSGEIASFMTPAKTNIKSLKVHFSPKQLGTGDPSPENVREIVGWDGVEVNGSGRNLLQNANGSLSYLYLKKGTTITISQSMDSNVGYFKGYDINKTTNTPLVWINQKNNGKRRWSEYTLEDDIYYAVCYTGTGMKEAQITLDGSVDYEPYQGNNILYQWKLPDEYQEVEWIESTGTQYIKTNISTNDLISVDLLAQFTESSDDSQVLFSASTNGVNWFGQRDNVYACGTSGVQKSTVDSTQKSKIHIVFNSNSIVCTIGDNTFLRTDSQHQNGQLYKLFNTDYPSKAKVFYCIIYNDDIAIANLVPCYRKSDNEIGMYDTVSQMFYTNSGTGTFLKGEDVNKTVYGGYVDLISGELVETNVAETFTSTPTDNTLYDAEDSIYFGLNSSYPFVSIYSSGAIASTSGVSTAPRNGLCNRLKIDNIDNWRGTQYINSLCSQYRLGGFSVRMSKDLFNLEDGYTWQEKQNAINEYLSANPIIVYYELKTPITHQLTPTQLKSFVGQNNFWSNADYVEIEYDLIETEDIQKCRKKIMLNQPYTESVIDDVVNFTTNMKAPLKECKVYFNPIQEGSGDPSPDNVRNIIGWDGVSVGLPSEYQEVEYIESTGFSWLETSINIKKNDIVSSELIFQNTSFYNYNVWFAGEGMQKDNLQHEYGFYGGNYGYLDNGIIAKYEYGENKYFSKTKAYFLNRTYNSNVTLTWRVGSRNGYNDLEITNCPPCKIWYNSFTINGNKVLEFIPCYRKSDGEIGMYDTVSKTFYTNSGTGTFLKGDDVNTIIGNVNWSDEVGTVYGGYVDLAKGEVVAEYFGFIADGENIKTNSGYVNDTSYGAGIVYMDRYGFPDSDRLRVNTYCNTLNPIRSTSQNCVYWATNGKFYLVFYPFSKTTEESKASSEALEETNEWLKQHPTQIVYKLRTPIRYQLTPQQLLTFKGENNIWSDTNGQTEVKFWTH